jgi:hypothetical protein
MVRNRQLSRIHESSHLAWHKRRHWQFFLTATLTDKILNLPAENSLAVMQKSVEVHQAYVHDYAIPRLWQMNRFWYNMFRDQRLFDCLVRCYWYLSCEEIDGQYAGTFKMRDLQWLIGAGGGEFQRFSGEFLDILEASREFFVDRQVLAKVQELAQQCLGQRGSLYPGNQWGRYLRKYDDELKRVEEKGRVLCYEMWGLQVLDV